MTAIIKRTTLKVRNMEKSLIFYEKVLGMKKYYDDEITLSGEMLPGGKAGDLTRLVIMESLDPEIGKIGLLQWLNPSTPPPPINFDFDYSGFAGDLPSARVLFVGFCPVRLISSARISPPAGFQSVWIL